MAPCDGQAGPNRWSAVVSRKAAATTDTARRYVPTCGGSPEPPWAARRSGQDGEACARPPPPDPEHHVSCWWACQMSSCSGLMPALVRTAGGAGGMSAGVLPVSVSTKISGPGGPLRRSTPYRGLAAGLSGLRDPGWVKQRPVVRLTDFTLVRSTL